jgi:hypothetical protein
VRSLHATALIAILIQFPAWIWWHTSIWTPVQSHNCARAVQAWSF